MPPFEESSAAPPGSAEPTPPPPLPAAAPAEEALPAATEPTTPEWPAWKSVLFRFVALYLGLYTLPFPIGTIPETASAAAKYESVVSDATIWFGEAVLRFSEPPRVFPTGSGDTPIEYCKAALFATVALLGTIAWSILARRRTAGHPRLHAALRIQVRYVLAATLLGYGFAKVFKTQFQAPDGESLFIPLGDKSPMGLLWTFMGFSTVYTIFVGAAEVLGGALLLFRRTTTLGALVCATVMLNVTLLNFCYDVPVKLYAAHLFAMAAFLAIPDVPRLVSALVLNRATPPATLRPYPLVDRFWARWPAAALKLLFAGYILVTTTRGGYATWKQYGETANLPGLHGIYEVTSFERDGEVIPPHAFDARLWKRFTVGRRGFASIATATNSVVYYQFEDDIMAREIKLSAGGRRPSGTEAAAPRQEVLKYDRPTLGELVLSGPFDGAALRVTLKRRERESFFLFERGFRWMQDYPVNR